MRVSHESEVLLIRLKVGLPLGTLCSQCSVSVIVKVKTQHVSSVKLISSLTLQTLVTANILGSPGSTAIKCTLMDSHKVKENAALLHQSSIRTNFKQAKNQSRLCLTV